MTKTIFTHRVLKINKTIVNSTLRPGAAYNSTQTERDTLWHALIRSNWSSKNREVHNLLHDYQITTEPRSHVQQKDSLEAQFVTCVCFFLFFRAAVRAFRLACFAYYCFITLHILSFLANKREREHVHKISWNVSMWFLRYATGQTDRQTNK